MLTIADRFLCEAGCNHVESSEVRGGAAGAGLAFEVSLPLCVVLEVEVSTSEL